MRDKSVTPVENGAPDPGRRRCVFTIAKAAAGTAAVAALYMAPMVVRIDDEAEAGSRRKGSRRKGGSRRRRARGSSGRRRSRQRFASRRRWW